MVDSVRRRVLPPVAGIPIIHECETGVELAVQADSWTDDVVLDYPLVIRHRVRQVDISGMTRLFTVVPGLEYLADRDGNVVNRYAPQVTPEQIAEDIPALLSPH